MLSLTKEEVDLLLQISGSRMDLYNDWGHNSDVSYRNCPLCKKWISETDKISSYVSEEFFNREILPDIYGDGIVELYNREEDFEYKNMLICYLPDQRIIPFAHKEGCKIEELKSLHKKMKDFAE